MTLKLMLVVLAGKLESDCEWLSEPGRKLVFLSLFFFSVLSLTLYLSACLLSIIC